MILNNKNSIISTGYYKCMKMKCLLKQYSFEFCCDNVICDNAQVFIVFHNISSFNFF